MSLLDRLRTTIGDAYDIDRELGGGGMSRVFLAEDVRLRRKVVVKVLSPELSSGMDMERFRREILLAAQLQHPHIVPVLTAGDADGVPYFTMPFVSGSSLRERIDANAVVDLASPRVWGFSATWRARWRSRTALTGDREGAIRAYRHYLAVRREPEPSVAAQVAAVRAELRRLERESVGR